MFGLFGERRRKIKRTAEAIRGLADMFEQNPPGLVGNLLSERDYEQERSPADPPSDVLKRMNFEMLAVVYLLHRAKAAGGNDGFETTLSLASEAFCQMNSQSPRDRAAMADFMRNYYNEWRPMVELDVFMAEPSPFG